MKPPWSSEEMQEIVREDSGFRNLLGSFPIYERNFLEKILSDESYFTNAFNLIPSSEKNTAVAYLTAVFETPQKALALYKQCRFFEARELLVDTLQLYKYQCNTMSAGLNKAVEFVTKRVQAISSNLLGDVEWELGNAEKAGKYYHQALKLAEEIGDIDTIGKALQGLAVYYWDTGDLEQGLSFCHRVLEILTGSDDRWMTMNKSLTSLCSMYGDLGQYEKSQEYAEQAVDLCTRSGDRQALPVALNNLASIYMDLDEYGLAGAALEEALEITREEENPRKEALILNNLALCLLRQSGTPAGVEPASAYLDTALAKSKETGSQSLLALTKGNLGFILQLTGRVGEAGEAFRESAEIYRQIGAKSCEATALHNLGNLLKEYAGDLEGACQSYGKAIDLMETIRGGLKKEAHRIGYADTAVEPYWMMIESLLQLGRDDEALAYVERGKSRALLEFLSKRLRDELPAKQDTAAFHQVKELLDEIEEIRKSLEAMQRQDEQGTEPSGERGSGAAHDDLLNPLLDQLAEKERALDSACAELNVLEPDNASLAKVLPLTAEEIRGTLAPDTVFLDLYQDDDDLSIFVVGHTGLVKVVAVDLTLGEAREGVWGLLTAMWDGRAQDIRSHDYIREVRQPLAHFYDLLIRPLEPYLVSCRRIIISPHLCWHYLPFQALYDRESKGFLCDRFEIGYSPSASVLRLCLRKNRLRRESAVIFARDNGDLPHVEREGELLAGAFYPDGDLYRGEKAHLGQLKNRGNGFDVVHIACHGIFDHEQPFLSGLDLPPGEGEERRTYLLDFFHQELDCSLVTLSACDSGLNRITNADELLGLSRGLFYAGAASVMLSLWQVADASTCYLMENFYWHYVKNRKSKTEALQLAMQAVKARSEYAHPYYWAPFVVMGDWR
jgi:CHAT domain-containing protein/Tfp pilus assembly protein PilF